MLPWYLVPRVPMHRCAIALALALHSVFSVSSDARMKHVKLAPLDGRENGKVAENLISAQLNRWAGRGSRKTFAIAPLLLQVLCRCCRCLADCVVQLSCAEESARSAPSTDSNQSGRGSRWPVGMVDLAAVE